jgi:nitrate reductase NapE component
VKPGDMNQIEDWDLKNGWAWRSMLFFGMALFAMLICSFVTGVFFGYLIWGV